MHAVRSQCMQGPAEQAAVLPAEGDLVPAAVPIIRLLAAEEVPILLEVLLHLEDFF